MTYYRSLTGERTIIDNSSVRSRGSDSIRGETNSDKIRKKEKIEQAGRNKRFLINGVDFHKEEIVVHKQGEVLEDSYSVKGDYFYLKRGDIVNIRYAIGEFVEIKF